jgi:hypothetical protein
MRGTHMRGTHMTGTHMRGTHMRGTHMRGTHMTGTHMRGTRVLYKGLFKKTEIKKLLRIRREMLLNWLLKRQRWRV